MFFVRSSNYMWYVMSIICLHSETMTICDCVFGMTSVGTPLLHTECYKLILHFFLQAGKFYGSCSYRVFVTISKQNNLKSLNVISNIHLE